MSQKRKAVEIYRDSPSAVAPEQPPAIMKSSTETASVSARDLSISKTDADLSQAQKHHTKPAFEEDVRENKDALTQAGDVSLSDDKVTKSPRKALVKVESEVDRESTKGILDEETHKKSSQKDILSETKLEVGQIPSESGTLKATSLTPSQEKISSASQHDNGSTRDEIGPVEATNVQNTDEPLTKEIKSTAGKASPHKEAPAVAHIGYPGLINEQYSCYQNTAYQILASTRPFADHVKGTRWADNETSAAADLDFIVKRGTAYKTKKARSKARKTSGSSKYANRAPSNSSRLTSK